MRWIAELLIFVRTLAPASSIDGPGITVLAITPDQAELVVGSQAGVVVRALDAREPTASVPTELEHVHDLTFSPDGTVLALAGGSPAEFGSVELWSWPERKLIRQLEGHDDAVHDVAWLSGGKLIASASADRTVRVWDAKSTELQATLTGHSGSVLCLAVSPDGKLLCSGSADQTIRVWDTTTWQLVRSMTNHLGPVHGLAFRAAGNSRETDPRPAYLASAGGDNTVRIWQPEIGRMVRIVRHPTSVLAVAWGAGGELYSGAKDSRVRMIDADDGEIRSEQLVGSGWIISLAQEAKHHKLVAGSSTGEVIVLDMPVPAS